MPIVGIIYCIEDIWNVCSVNLRLVTKNNYHYGHILRTLPINTMHIKMELQLNCGTKKKKRKSQLFVYVARKPK